MCQSPEAQGHHVYLTEQNYFTHWNENALVYSKQATNKHKKYVFLLKKKNSNRVLSYDSSENMLVTVTWKALFPEDWIWVFPSQSYSFYSLTPNSTFPHLVWIFLTKPFYFLFIKQKLSRDLAFLKSLQDMKTALHRRAQIYKHQLMTNTAVLNQF